MEEYGADDDATLLLGGDGAQQTGKIQCLPLPGPFLPCQDLFDWWTLRCGVWIVFLCAMLGNGTVVFVLIFSRSKMDVPRFLVCNLAAADFFMGIYLGNISNPSVKQPLKLFLQVSWPLWMHPRLVNSGCTQSHGKCPPVVNWPVF